MEKEFIPYEQALALKELGFNEPCLGFYVGKDKEVFMSSNDFNAPYQFRLDSKITFVAPTFSQAFRWLLVLVNKDEQFSNKWTISYNEDYYSLFLGGCNMGVFKTELQCLLKLIEIIKNK